MALLDCAQRLENLEAVGRDISYASTLIVDMPS